MKNNRVLSLILAVIMLLSVVFPVSVFADEIVLWDEEGEQEYIEDSWSEEDNQEIVFEEYQNDEADTASEEELILVEDADEEQNVVVVEEIITETEPDVADENAQIQDENPAAVETEVQHDETAAADELIAADTFDAAFAIVDEPVNAEANVGEAVEFTVNATGVATYTWKYRASATGSWKAMYSSATGANTKTLKTEATDARYKYEYQCVLTSASGETLKTAIVKIVKPSEQFAIVDEPVDVEANVGEAVEFTVNATGVATYTWKYRASATGSWKAMYSSATGANTKTLKTEATDARYKYEYQCVLTSASGETLKTAIVKIVKPAAFIEDDVEYAVLDADHISVEKYLGNASAVTIPEIVRGYTVVEIGKEAFMDNTVLSSIDLPDTITVIRERAFKGCINLSSMS